MPKFLVGVLAVIFDDRGRVLLLKHTYRPDYPWGLPGGWLRAGEGAAEGIERELLEETGFVVRAIRPLMSAISFSSSSWPLCPASAVK